MPCLSIFANANPMQCTFLVLEDEQRCMEAFASSALLLGDGSGERYRHAFNYEIGMYATDEHTSFEGVGLGIRVLRDCHFVNGRVVSDASYVSFGYV